MNFDEFKALFFKFNFEPLGLKIGSFIYEESVSESDSKQMFISYSVILYCNTIEIDLRYSVTADYFRARIKKDEKNYFTISEYLKSKNRETEDISLDVRPGESTSEHFLRFLKQVFDLTKGELQPIIRGNIWEDIPRDWMGYK